MQEIMHEGQLVPNMSCVPGWDLDFLLGDLQHEAALGIAPVAVGTSLVEMAEKKAFSSAHAHGAILSSGGRYEDQLAFELRMAYIAFKSWCKRHGVKHSQPKFGVNLLSMAGGRKKWPLLKSKAHNCMCVCRWLTFSVS